MLIPLSVIVSVMIDYKKYAVLELARRQRSYNILAPTESDSVGIPLLCPMFLNNF